MSNVLTFESDGDAIAARHNGRVIADFARFDDGCYYARLGSRGVYWPDWMLKEIADKMEELNAPTYAHYEKSREESMSKPQEGGK